MDKILVDSNILFSAILNVNSRIGQILLNGEEYYEFYSPKYVRTELLRHKSKIQKIAGYTDEEFLEVYELLLKNVTVLDHAILPEKDLKIALEYCKDIDLDDTIFVAFSEYLKARLYTGDKKLIRGLKAKGFKRTMDTDALFKDFMNKHRLGK